MSIVNAVVIVLWAFLVPRAAIADENLYLRQQLAVAALSSLFKHLVKHGVADRNPVRVSRLFT